MYHQQSVGKITTSQFNQTTKEKQADLDKNQLSGSDKTAGIQILSKIGPE